MADITLNSAVRGNLRTLQATTDLMSRTEERLSTGKKVNSALDNPTNFFTAQGLERRSGDLSSLLDSVSNSVKTLEAADNGIKAITDLVAQMKSTARSAQQSSSAVATAANFQSSAIVGASATNLLGGTAQVGTAQVGTAQVGTAQVGTAQVGTAQVGTAAVGTAQVGTAQVGTAQVGTAAVATTFDSAEAYGTTAAGDITINSQTVSLTTGMTFADFKTAAEGAVDGLTVTQGGDGKVQYSLDSGEDIAIDGTTPQLESIGAVSTGGSDTSVTSTNGEVASNDYAPASNDYAPASNDYVAASNDYAPASNDYAPASNDYVAASNDYAPASNDFVAASNDYAAASADYQAAVPGLSGTLTVSVDGASETTITFGTGDGEVSTLDELNAQLSTANAKATFGSDGKLTIQTANQNEADSLKIGGTLVSTDGTPATGEIFSVASPAGATKSASLDTSDSKTRLDYKNDYNDLRDQIQQLAKDASYNGINLLSGDDLKVVFNEDGSSSLDISGVDVMDKLGLSDLADSDFMDSSSIDKVVDTLNSALDNLDSLSSKFGSQLSVVQTRQDFTKDMVATLDGGADLLTSADTNEEAANLATLQTRQSLIVSSLSISTQQEQNILQLLR